MRGTLLYATASFAWVYANYGRAGAFIPSPRANHEIDLNIFLVAAGIKDSLTDNWIFRTEYRYYGIDETQSFPITAA